MTSHSVLFVAAALVSFACASGVTSDAWAQGDIRPYDSSTPVEGWDGVDYVQYDGLFCMGGDETTENEDCESLVTYRITTPVNSEHGNGVAVIEPAHFVQGVDAWWLGHNFLLSRGFTHAGIGYSTVWNRIVDPRFDENGETVVNVRGVDPCGPVFNAACFATEQTDDLIIREFAIALAEDPDAWDMIGNNARFRYMMGYSDSSGPVKRLIAHGAEAVFDFAMPMTTGGDVSPLDALGEEGDYDGVVIVVNSENDDRGANADDLWDETGAAVHQYRYFTVPGTAHISDHRERLNTPANPDFADHTTPADWQPELRARFWQGHRWVRSGRTPPPSHRLARDEDGVILVDDNGNTYAVDATGAEVPAPPYIALGEAHFVWGFLGTVEDLAQVEDCSDPDAVCLFDDFDDYYDAFVHATEDYKRAVRLMEEDADAIITRAGLCPPLTYTETYVYEYEAFIDMEPCE